MTRHVAALLIGVGAMLACGPAMAQSYPSKDVNLIVPFPTAGVTDLNARILAKHLSKFWKQPVTVTNMPGGGGTKGTMFVLGFGEGRLHHDDERDRAGHAEPRHRQQAALQVGRALAGRAHQHQPAGLRRERLLALDLAPAGGRRREEGSRQVSNTARPARAASAASRCRCCSAATASTCKSSAASSCRAAHRCSMHVATGETHFAAQYLAEMGPQLESKKLKAAGRQHGNARQAAAGHAHLAGGGLRHLHADRMERDRRSVATAGRHRRPAGTRRSRRSPPTRRSSRRPKRRALKSPISTRSGSRRRSRRNTRRR